MAYKAWFWNYVIIKQEERGNMEVRLIKCNNALCLKLPKEIAEAVNIKENDIVDIQVIDNKLVILPKQTLEDMLSKINDDNLHNSIDFGTAGKELW